MRASRHWLVLTVSLWTGCDDIFDLERIEYTAPRDAADATDATGASNDVVQIAAGGRSSCALRRSGDLWCWGRASELMAATDHTRPGFVLADVAHAGVGDGGVCATLRTGRVKCWGENKYGVLGLGHATPVGAAMEMLASTQPAEDVAEVALGHTIGCARYLDGRVTCVGQAGRHGDSTSVATTAHGDMVALATKAVALAAGDDHACALLDNGELWCWGSNTFHQLGVLGVDGLLPVKVDGGPWVAVAAGDEFTCAIQEADRSVWCWGRNEELQTGNGAAGDHAHPTLVGGQGASGAQSIAAGATTGYLVVASGAVLGWGDNAYYQLGDGTSADRPLASALALQGIAEISSGTGLHACARSVDHRLFCWGYNSTGQVGVGDLVNHPTIVEVKLP